MSEEIKLWDGVPGNEFDDERDMQNYPTWINDPTHSTPRMMAMEAWFWSKYDIGGTVRVRDNVCIPGVKGGLRRIRKGADYVCILPERDVEEVKQAEIKFREQVTTLSADFPQWWSEAKEELMEIYNRFKGIDLDAASDGDLLDHLYDLINTSRRMWHIHWIGMSITGGAYMLFEELTKELWGMDDFNPKFQKLMTGFDNKMLQVDKRLWQLAQSAVNIGISDMIKNTSPEELFQKLEQGKGKQWQKEFKDFLDEDGWRMAHGHIFHEAAWIEDPTPAIERIKGFIQKSGDFISEEIRSKLVKEREDTLAALLPEVPKKRKDEFLKLLAAAQLFGMYNDEHSYYCENYCHAIIRRGLLGIGRRLVKGKVIDQAEDIFLLNPPEVESVLPCPEICDLRFLVERRRKEWEEWQELEAPPILTSRTSMEIVMEKDLVMPKYNPIFEKITVGPMPIVNPDLKADFYGIPGSAGVAEGPVRVVMTDKELAEVKAGEILVAPFTMTSWTPVFNLIKGVVTETGGVVAHTAVAAREYGIPAVLKIGGVTDTLKTGQRVRVDGNKGVVFKLD